MFETIMNVLAGIVCGVCLLILIGVPFTYILSRFSDPFEGLEESLNMEIEDETPSSEPVVPFRD